MVASRDDFIKLPTGNKLATIYRYASAMGDYNLSQGMPVDEVYKTREQWTNDTIRSEMDKQPYIQDVGEAIVQGAASVMGGKLEELGKRLPPPEQISETPIGGGAELPAQRMQRELRALNAPQESVFTSMGRPLTEQQTFKPDIGTEQDIAVKFGSGLGSTLPDVALAYGLGPTPLGVAVGLGSSALSLANENRNRGMALLADRQDLSDAQKDKLATEYANAAMLGAPVDYLGDLITARLPFGKSLGLIKSLAVKSGAQGLTEAGQQAISNVPLLKAGLISPTQSQAEILEQGVIGTGIGGLLGAPGSVATEITSRPLREAEARAAEVDRQRMREQMSALETPPTQGEQVNVGLNEQEAAALEAYDTGQTDHPLYNTGKMIAERGTAFVEKGIEAKRARGETVEATPEEMGMTEEEAEALKKSAEAPPAPEEEKPTHEGRATWFGLNPDGSTDTQDNGQGAFIDKRTGKPYDTRDPRLVGVALPFRTLNSIFGDDYRTNPEVKAAIESGQYYVEVIGPDGQRVNARIVDAGPAEWTGNAIDLTYGAGTALGITSGAANVKFSVKRAADGTTVAFTEAPGGGPSRTAREASPREFTINGKRYVLASESGPMLPSQEAPRGVAEAPEGQYTEEAPVEPAEPVTERQTPIPQPARPEEGAKPSFRPTSEDNYLRDKVVSIIQAAAGQQLKVSEATLTSVAQKGTDLDVRAALTNESSLMYTPETVAAARSKAETELQNQGGNVHNFIKAAKADKDLTPFEKTIAMQFAADKLQNSLREAQSKGASLTSDKLRRDLVALHREMNQNARDAAKELAARAAKYSVGERARQFYQTTTEGSVAKVAARPEAQKIAAATKEAANELEQAIGPAMGQAGGVSVAEAQSVLDSVKASYPNMPQAQVVASVISLPPEVQMDLKASGRWNTAKAFLWSDGQREISYIIADRHSSAQDVRESIEEEAIGHYGLETASGKAFQSTLKMVQERYGNTLEFKRLSEQYGSAEEAAREYLAKLAQGEIKDPTFLGKITSSAAKFLRSKLGANIKITNAEVQKLLSLARKRVAEGGQRPAPKKGISFALRPEGREQFLARITAKRGKEILRRKMAEKGVRKRLNKDSIERLLNIMAAGGVQDEAIYNAIAPDFNLPTYSPEVAQKIDESAERLAALIGQGKTGKDYLSEIYDLNKILFESQPRLKKWGDTYMSSYMGALLSGIQTHEINSLGNLFSAMPNVGVEGIRSRNVKATASAYTAFFKELFGTGAAAAGYTLKTGKRVYIAGDKYEAAAIGSYTPSEYAKGPLSIYKWAGRALGAMDGAFYMANKGALAYLDSFQAAKKAGVSARDAVNEAWNNVFGDEKAAFETAIKEGNKGMEAKIRAREILDDAIDTEILGEAQRRALENIYANKPEGLFGDLANLINQWHSKTHQTSRIIVPFTNVVANIANEYLRYTPLGLAEIVSIKRGGKAHLSEEAKKTRIQQVGLKMTLGMIATIGAWVMNDMEEDKDNPMFRIHGGGPSDIDKKKQLQSRGWKPYSIQIGDVYLPYMYTPMGYALGFLGDIKDQQRYEKEIPDILMATLTMVTGPVGMLSDQTFLSGMKDLFVAFSQGKSAQETSNFVGRLLSTMAGPLTGGAMNSSVRQFLGHPQRKAYNLEGVIMKNVPIVGDALTEPMYNVLGDEVRTSPQGRIINFAPDDPVWKFLGERKLWVSDSNITAIAGRPITDKQKRDYKVLRGRALKNLIQSNMYKFSTMDEAKAAEYLDKLEERAKELGKSRVLRGESP
jgi:hypothetical protein